MSTDTEAPPREWIGADPTNRRLAGEEHVKIGHGRHYSDVSVKMTRLE